MDGHCIRRLASTFILLLFIFASHWTQGKSQASKAYLKNIEFTTTSIFASNLWGEVGPFNNSRIHRWEYKMDMRLQIKLNFCYNKIG
jgi:hypothetical protein